MENKKIMTGVLLINNKTDKEYRIESTNEFGLDYIIRDNLIMINQKLSLHDSCSVHYEYLGIGRFIDFSILDSFYKDLD